MDLLHPQFGIKIVERLGDYTVTPVQYNMEGTDKL